MTEAIVERAEGIYNATTPMGCIGKPGKIAPAVLFLASEGRVVLWGRLLLLMGGGVCDNW